MNAHDILFFGDQTLLASIDQIPASARTTPGVVGWWSAREIMAHLAIVEEMLVEVLETVLYGGPTPSYAKLTPESNDGFVAQKKDRTFDELFAEYHAAHDRTMSLIGEISPEKLREVGTLPWYGTEYSLDDFIVYGYYGHKREHAAAFDVFHDTLKAKGVVSKG